MLTNGQRVIRSPWGTVWQRVIATMHRMCGDMIKVVDCFAVSAWQAGRIPSSVFLSFGSLQQKSTFFKIMANRIRFGNEQYQSVQVLPCRKPSLTLSLTAPCAPRYLTALGLICPIKIGLICPRAMS
jgi:hypothetical protein